MPKHSTLGENGKVPTEQLPAGQGGAAWGGITGTLSDQTDLTNALGAKAASTHEHAGVYEPADTGIQTHVQSAHAPATAEQNVNADWNAGSGDAQILNKPALAQLHDRQHTVTNTADHVFPGGTTNFLRSDGTFAAPPGGSAYTLVATLAADQATGANVTPVTLTDLIFTYAANSKYRIWFMGRVSPAAAGTGCGFQFDLSSAVTAIDVIFYHQLANTGTLTGGHSIADDASVGVSSGMPATSTYTIVGAGLLITTGNAGTAQLRFRSETTAVTTCKAGMTLVVEKIA